jgi:hypothetical protein
MMQEERQALLSLLEQEAHWCREAEARNAAGEPTQFDDDDAVAWDLTGALCKLFGWERACSLFGQFDRHINGKRVPVLLTRDNGIGAMVALQVFNDRAETTFADVRGCIDSMPIWSSGTRTSTETPV